MSRLFKLKGVANKKERNLGIMFRIFRVDVSILLVGWVDDMRLIDLRVPCNWGVYLQLLFLIINIGLLDDSVYTASGD